MHWDSEKSRISKVWDYAGLRLGILPLIKRITIREAIKPTEIATMSGAPARKASTATTPMTSHGVRSSKKIRPMLGRVGFLIFFAIASLLGRFLRVAQYRGPDIRAIRDGDSRVDNGVNNGAPSPDSGILEDDRALDSRSDADDCAL
jgi:hypothetical protein